MDDLQTIRDKAARHQARYRTFNMPCFLRWVERQPARWQAWAATQPIARLTRIRRSEVWATISAKPPQYTPEPPED